MSIDPTKIKTYVDQFGIPEETVLRIAVDEGFMRRAALVNGQFMLKGSYVTRQYLEEGWKRIPGDLDWVGFGDLDERELTQWVTAVTETSIDDGVRFRSFSENAFWRSIEHAMDDATPTVNTDLLAWVGDKPLEIRRMDVTCGLTIEPMPGPLAYRPQFGEAFEMRLSCPLELQVAWKLHQCMVRPRFQDLLDLILLLRENVIDRKPVWRALKQECYSIPILQQFNWLLDAELGRHPDWRRERSGKHSASEQYSVWRNAAGWDSPLYQDEVNLALLYVDKSSVPATFEELLSELAAHLKSAGFTRVPMGETAHELAINGARASIKGLFNRWIGGK
jgi:hypothetical protein